CPSEKHYVFDSFAAYGRLRMMLAMLHGNLDYSPRVLEAIYACQLCGACDVGCKRNLDLEIEGALEALRIKAVQDGYGPMPEHKEVAEKIEASHNYFGAPHDKRARWLPAEAVDVKADVAYFVGCEAAYTHPQIAQSTAKILQAAGAPFTVMSDEWCCGYPLYHTGQLEAAKKVAQHNLEVMKATGASTVLTSCAECYRTLKVDYPKIFNKSTSDLGFQVVHLAEYADGLIKEGALKLTKPVPLSVAYHDSCNLARRSEPWTYWEGERLKYGIVSPTPPARRRGTYGVYQQPRDILNSIPGLELREPVRMRENAWCSGAGGGVREAFKDFALSCAMDLLEEVDTTGAEAIVTTCPRAEENLRDALKKNGWKTQVFDLAEVIAQAI
ncbi:MAG TPA: heterodisulfide reductase-related iron-sulfur binding cluster, partial [Dehalococcoidia bacterium]|nr:heterodisulfide reductase-related iron-sulfur binding cluster [Dehalococcoidia bacterium]